MEVNAVENQNDTLLSALQEHEAAKNRSMSNQHQGERTIVGIVCPSYSGSTLLTALLGSHSQIFGGGELHWLLSQDQERVDTIIKASESHLQTDLIWRELFEAKLSPNQLYESIFDRIQQRIIIDSSKRPNFFERIVPKNKAKNFIFIYLVKHPMRLLSSHIMHRGNKPEFDGIDRPQQIHRILDDVYQQLVYQHLIASKIGNGNHMLFVKYEDIVTSTRTTVNYILKELGLSFEEDILQYNTHKHYMLGGNAGPRSQISRSHSGGEAHFDNKIQGDFYKNLDGISMDNNYNVFFTPEEIAHLNQTEKMRTLLHILGYSPIQ